LRIKEQETHLILPVHDDDDDEDEDEEEEEPYNINTAHVECKNKCDTSNNRGNWNHLRITQKIPEKHNRRRRNRGTTENSHTGHCTHTEESINVKVQYNTGNSVICTANSNWRIAATLYFLEI
jgi:hypothetical protein